MKSKILAQLLFVFQICFVLNDDATRLQGFRKHPITDMVKKLKRVVCPDGKDECMSGSTCCKLPSGGYGCCPYDDAICCSDQKHCCPEGFRCNLSHGTCENGCKSFKYKSLIVSKERRPWSAVHNNNTDPISKIAENYDCPFTKAACCSDDEHCCPHGHVCDLAKRTCNRHAVMIGLTGTNGAHGNSKSVLCRDGNGECADGTTCCMLHSGTHRCCPLPEAICCADGKHCCPHGSMCNSSMGACVMINQKSKFSDIDILAQNLVNVICPGEEQCPEGYTCCKSSSGRYDYECCPRPNAVCCSDGKNCCPHGYICDQDKGSCIKKSPLHSFKKTPSGITDDEETAILH